jgi:hypothetical protein
MVSGGGGFWLHYNPSFVGGYVGSRNEHVGAIIQKRSRFFRLGQQSGGGDGLPTIDGVTAPWSPDAVQQAGLGGEDLRGPALILIGQPIRALKPVGALGSKAGSSVASYTLSKALPQKMAVRVMGTKVLGRALGRLVPYAGWALTAYDVNEFLRETFPSYDNFINTQNQLNQQYGGATYVGSDGIYVCFEAGTLIYTEKGLQPIEELEEGIMVYSYNFDTDSVELQPITKFFRREVSEIYDVSAGNEQISVTAEHPFYVQGKEWVKVKDLVPGDRLQSEPRSVVEISGTNRKKNRVTVYNIEVEGTHNYFVSATKILVHNKSISEMSSEEEAEQKEETLEQVNHE